MKDDLKAKLRAVFLAESSEDLAEINSQLKSMEALLPEPPKQVLEAFYRAVHKLKGACRAIGIQWAERLGYQIEYLFRALVERPHTISPEMYAAVQNGVNHMQAHIHAYLNDEALALELEIVEALNTFLKVAGSKEQVELPDSANKLSDAAPPAPKPPVAAPSAPAQNKLPVKRVDPRLQQAFHAEARDLIRAARKEIESIRVVSNLSSAKQCIDELLRAAHTLKGSSRVVQMSEVGKAAHELESLLEECARASDLEVLSTQLVQIEAMVDTIEGLFSDDVDQKARGDFRAVDSSKPSPNVPKADQAFYRIDSDRMNALFENYSELLLLQPELEALSSNGSKTKESLLNLLRDERELRYQIGPSLHKPGFAKMASYVNYMSRQLKQLSQQVVAQEKHLQQIGHNFDSKMSRMDRNVNDMQQTAVDDVLTGLRPMVRGIAEELGKQVDFVVEGFSVQADRTVLQKLRSPLIHLLRNSLDHGIEKPAQRDSAGKPLTAKLYLRFDVSGDRFSVYLEDDGRGVPTDKLLVKAVDRGLLTRQEATRLSSQEVLNLAFSPHLSTSDMAGDVSGRGMGLSAVAETVRSLNGQVRMQSIPGAGTNFTISLPLRRSTTSLTLVRCGESTYGVASKQITHTCRQSRDTIVEVDGRLRCRYDDELIPFEMLSARLGMTSRLTDSEGLLSLLIVQVANQRQAICVDAILGEQKTVLRELPYHASRNPLFENGFLLPGGVCALVLNLENSGFVKGLTPASFNAELEARAELQDGPQIPRILVVDDSYTSRTLEVGVLEGCGYQVFDAVDGYDALRVLRNEAIDLVVSDIEMPRMDGFELLKEIKANERWKDIPVIMISSLETEQTVRKGLSLGADAYIVKRNFEHQELIETIEQYL